MALYNQPDYDDEDFATITGPSDFDGLTITSGTTSLVIDCSERWGVDITVIATFASGTTAGTDDMLVDIYPSGNGTDADTDSVQYIISATASTTKRRTYKMPRQKGYFVKLTRRGGSATLTGSVKHNKWRNEQVEV